MARKAKHPGSEISKAILKVGSGRGFIVEHRVGLPRFEGKPRFLDERLVITAAHCLPGLPTCSAAGHYLDRIYPNLLGALDAGELEVSADCLFADPVADVAVLGCPDIQVMYDEAERFEALTKQAPSLRIGKVPRESGAWLLTLSGQWVRCSIELVDKGLWIEKSSRIDGGMSGSPILADGGTAIGLVCLGVEATSLDGTRRVERSGPNPVLEFHLPGWLFQFPSNDVC
jgi:hypothetical protein